MNEAAAKSGVETANAEVRRAEDRGWTGYPRGWIV